MKIIAQYSNSGHCIPDLSVVEWADGVIDMAKRCEVYSINVGTETMINALRLKVYHKHIDPNDITFVYKGRELKVDEYGRFAKWPMGFCDTNSMILQLILGK